MERTIASAYHNYLVQGKLCTSLVVGDPEDLQGFFFMAHEVTPADPIPLLSGRLFDEKGELLLEMRENQLIENPFGFSFLQMRDGWTLFDNSLKALLYAEVRAFRNGYLTIIRGQLRDREGRPRLIGDHNGISLIEASPRKR